MGDQLPIACRKEAALMSWECPLAVEANQLTSRQLRRLRLGTELSLVVRDGGKAYRMWNAPSLSDYLLTDVHSDDHKIHLSKKRKSSMMQCICELKEK